MSEAPLLPHEALPSRKAKRFWLFVGANMLFLAGATRVLELDPLVLFTDFHYIVDLLGEMLPPAFELFYQDARVWLLLAETLAMATIGTALGFALAFVLAFLAARNTTPFPLLRGPCRVLLGAMRAAPDFAIMLVIVVAVGFGPFAGSLALVIGSAGMFGKLFADAVEQIEAATVDSLAVVGASRLQTIRYAVLPQVLPSFVANGLYLFEFNTASAVALGTFGAGGLGFAVRVAEQTLNYPDVMAYIIVWVGLMTVVEKLSDRIRTRLFAADEKG